MTRTRVRVERVVAALGTVTSEVEIRSRGGIVESTGQVVEGEASFEVGASSLLFLRKIGSNDSDGYAVTERGQGQFH
ncbi:hypothetical protein, partial [Streptomyces caniscabiei]|uniref:hypothetical protein n=1 Tax=Streptomyces caniscabiei TaxID=2746961 RepID=UPI0038F74558